jgi:ATP-dependent exoDNAse (exonuclease V) beta subunit
MYEKIYKRLKAENDPLIQEQLKAFNQAQISTLDSFCAQIVRNASELFGLASDFSYDAPRLSALMAEASLDFLLTNWESPGLAVLLHEHGFERILDDFLLPIAESCFTLAYELDFPEMFKKQVLELDLQLKAQTKQFVSCAARLGAMEAQGSKSILAAQDALAGMRGLENRLTRFEYKEALEILNSLVLKKPGGKAGEQIVLLKSLIDELNASREHLVTILTSLDKKKEMEDIFKLLPEFQKLVGARKRREGLVSFGDVAEMAVQVLKRNKGLRSYYKNRFRYIMIDEFQDNNLLQKELLYLIGEKKELALDSIPQAGDLEKEKLLFVGDEKQSIYGFRGADVSVFKALQGELCAQGGSMLLLPNNYRSEPGLIAFFNPLFRKIMEPALADYEARFQELRSPKQGNTVDPEIHFFYKEFDPDSKEDSDYSKDEAEAFRLAQFISRSVKEKRFSLSEGHGLRPAVYDDFVILMRSTSNQIIYERMFRLFGIPYTTDGVRSLFLEAPINDIYHLLQLAENPADRLSYAALLRSPLVNLSDEGFITVMLKKEPPFRAIELAEEDALKYEAGRALYEFMQAKADRVPLSELIFHVWYTFGYRYHILKNKQFHTFLEYYDYFFRLAEQADGQGWMLSRFLDLIRRNLGQYEKQEDLEILKEYEAGVHLMTIHKAKGLEFPIVVLANTGNKGRSEDKKALYYYSSRFGISLKLGRHNYFYLLCQEENEKKEIAELKRLLYVALTRAKAHLIISGVHNSQNRNSPKAHLNMLLRGLGREQGLETGEAGQLPIVETGYGTGQGFEAKQGRGPQQETEDGKATFQFILHPIKELSREEYSSVFRRPAGADIKAFEEFFKTAPEFSREFRRTEYSVTELNLLYRNLKKDHPLAGQSLELPGLPIDAFLLEKKSVLALGSLTHYLIHAGIKGGSLEDEIPLQYLRDIPPELAGQAVAAARELARGFFSSSCGELLKQAQSVETEFPFLYKFTTASGTYYINGIIDLFFVTADTAYVLDFKTDKVLKPLEYALQLDLYKKACAELTSKKLSVFLFPLRKPEPFYIDHEVDWDTVWGGL